MLQAAHTLGRRQPRAPAQDQPWPAPPPPAPRAQLPRRGWQPPPSPWLPSRLFQQPVHPVLPGPSLLQLQPQQRQQRQQPQQRKHCPPRRRGQQPGWPPQPQQLLHRQRRCCQLPLCHRHKRRRLRRLRPSPPCRRLPRTTHRRLLSARVVRTSFGSLCCHDGPRSSSVAVTTARAPLPSVGGVGHGWGSGCCVLFGRSGRRSSCSWWQRDGDRAAAGVGDWSSR
mmetsp:Transcript_104426/g.239171  ORF Transcript_104426/g.239171 Transcript_104426/m.239171 type:complete len:225 (+) Transcript_104426:2016-2690(+)